MTSRTQRELRTIVRQRDGPLCHWCGRETFEREPGFRKRFDDATLEHLTPRSRGGTDAQANLRLACRDCNEARGNFRS